jgi:hypothetical protein
MNLINLSDKRWSKFKQELIPIIYLSILQTVWNFNLPLIMKFKSPWSIILATIMSVLGAIIIAYSFTFADTFATHFNPELQHLDNIPYSELLKKLHRITPVAVFHVVLFIFWYKNPYGMSNAQHAAQYVIRLTSWILLYRAMYCEPVEE